MLRAGLGSLSLPVPLVDGVAVGPQREVRGLAEEMNEQDVLGRDRRVRFQLEAPMTVRVPLGEQRLGGGLDPRIEGSGIRDRRQIVPDRDNEVHRLCL